ncbi:hypothetical protein [Zunongwangia sp.]|uniref:hypothetical protein n=1 Tax=Zunongwangia sp. TaxID=1965325 RepID=UPI003AA9C7D0
MKYSIKQESDTLQRPISLIHSEDNSTITTAMVYEKILPNLTFKKIIETKNLGHLMPIEDPKWLSEQLIFCIE